MAGEPGSSSESLGLKIEDELTTRPTATTFSTALGSRLGKRLVTDDAQGPLPEDRAVSDDPTAQRRDATKSRRLSSTAGLLIAVALLAGLAWILYARWSELQAESFRPSWWLVVSTVVALFCYNIAFAAQWRVLMNAVGVRLSTTEAAGIHLLSQAAKYVPGKVALLVGKVYLCVRQGSDVQLATVGILWAQAVVVVSGAAVVICASLLTTMPAIREHRRLLFAVCAAGAVCLHPAVVRFVVRSGSRLLPGRTRSVTMSSGVVLGLLCRFAFTWVLYGLILYWLAWGLHGVPLRYLSDFVGIMTFASVVGFLAFLVPAGLGVREFTLSLLLSAYVPGPVALGIALAHRVLATAADFVGALLSLALHAYWQAPNATGSGKGSGGEPIQPQDTQAV